jgi:hypothetical protein
LKFRTVRQKGKREKELKKVKTKKVPFIFGTEFEISKHAQPLNRTLFGTGQQAEVAVIT